MFLMGIISVLVISFIYLLNERNNISKQKIDHNKESIEALKSENENLKEEIRILENEMQLREDEIAYWGMKYDSIKSLRE